jgi:RTX calcium-binding nonapeptide repeat (4 copies)
VLLLYILLLKKTNMIIGIAIILILTSLLFSGVSVSLIKSVEASSGVSVSTIKLAQSNDNDLPDLDDEATDLDKLGDKIGGLEIDRNRALGQSKVGNVITCAALIPCIGTNHDDIIYAGIREQVFAKDGNDIVYGGGLSDQVYGGDDDDLLIAGPGKTLLDGGRDDDVLLAGLGNALLAGGSGNDKLFGGTGTAVMYGGKGANHFDCQLSALGLARSIVMDFNPTNGDTISGFCKIVNTQGNGNSDSVDGIPQVTLPDTGETDSSSSTSEAGTSSSPIIPGTTIGSPQ